MGRWWQLGTDPGAEPRGKGGMQRSAGFGVSAGWLEGPLGVLETPGGEAGVERENSEGTVTGGRRPNSLVAGGCWKPELWERSGPEMKIWGSFRRRCVSAGVR